MVRDELSVYNTPQPGAALDKKKVARAPRHDAGSSRRTWSACPRPAKRSRLLSRWWDAIADCYVTQSVISAAVSPL